MKYKLLYSPEALDDLDEITEYFIPLRKRLFILSVSSTVGGTICASFLNESIMIKEKHHGLSG